MIRKVEKSQTSAYIYWLPAEHTCSAAVEWICEILNTGTVQTDVLVLRDEQRSIFDGSLTTEITAPFEANSIAEKALELDSDRIFLMGELLEKPIAISIDLHTFEVCVSTRKRNPLAVEIIEEMLHLK